MRSHPYQPQAPLVSEIADFMPIPNRTVERRRGSCGPYGDELGDLDPETSRLLPTPTNDTTGSVSPRLGHHVMVQGRLAVVQSVSVAGLRVPSASPHQHSPSSHSPHSTHPHSYPQPSPGPPAGGGSFAGASRRGSIVGASPGSVSGSSLVQSPRGFENGVGGTVRRQHRVGRGGAVVVGPRRRETTGDYFINDASGGRDGSPDGEESRRGRERDRQFRGYGIGGAGNIRRPTDVTYRRRATSASPDRRRWNVREFLGLVDRKGKSREAPS
ncbi:hypothetical protein MKZ38_006650 [Zalerion maritima]|uniref:Uncharacterized protein n=1 Tax=Zalerion maritima TaxID=339359 RepID=A0AAD5RWE7_9PEZI|nr:hypothetical protein MKZ38_006650 [Zalerion maritima]